ncbi:MAG: hypothetical protein O7B26_02190 [Planctomycetota bacterium]|nr:hypothetical protein [Planctomycetota bacterium]
MFKNARLRGSSLIEVSSLLSVLALAAGLLVPAASTVTTESRRLRSVENLRKIGERSFIWSGGREDGIIHPQSTGGETDFWDWGRGTGAVPTVRVCLMGAPDRSPRKRGR